MAQKKNEMGKMGEKKNQTIHTQKSNFTTRKMLTRNIRTNVEFENTRMRRSLSLFSVRQKLLHRFRTILVA